MSKFWKKAAAALLALALLVGSQALRVMADEGMAPAKMPADFDKLKSLVGTWKGTADKMGKTNDVTNTFELTSGGSAILEKVCAGTPKEMVSMYCAEGGKMVMTHYCSIGNQPKMSLKSASDNEMDFEMTGSTGLGSKKEMHMHRMAITWKDKDHITETWTLFDKGKESHSSPFVLARVK